MDNFVHNAANKTSEFLQYVVVRVGNLEFEVTETSISTAIGFPISGEKWFKAMVLISPFVKDLFKHEY
jgi:hypothetical protein